MFSSSSPLQNHKHRRCLRQSSSGSATGRRCFFLWLISTCRRSRRTHSLHRHRIPPPPGPGSRSRCSTATRSVFGRTAADSATKGISLWQNGSGQRNQRHQSLAERQRTAQGNGSFSLVTVGSSVASLARHSPPAALAVKWRWSVGGDCVGAAAKKVLVGGKIALVGGKMVSVGRAAHPKRLDAGGPGGGLCVVE